MRCEVQQREQSNKAVQNHLNCAIRSCGLRPQVNQFWRETAAQPAEAHSRTHLRESNPHEHQGVPVERPVLSPVLMPGKGCAAAIGASRDSQVKTRTKGQRAQHVPAGLLMTMLR
jgi:hypothetical protein